VLFSSHEKKFILLLLYRSNAIELHGQIANADTSRPILKMLSKAAKRDR